MATVDHWACKDIKAECFSGDRQADVIDEINTWLQDKQDISVLVIRCSFIDDDECMTVFYE